ncbi:putative NBD/HSP70 family sugar kinase [Neobacillus niacini]|uniref:ROK family transcriptional regulator n=1 Tax=Neobacillus niacini TaxID=86668 RepID=UPI00285CF48A|nr:ROK family transcriptional regulator [Neobacillus niacini]MDR7076944.1 putative NBD/HSP70 family sugar kinase [Neobacillus niacini]
MVTGDASFIKKINRSHIISKIIEHGMISRADLAKITGLNKATISVQVADLLEEELIIETQQEHKSLGRRPIMLSINHQAGFSLGIDLDKNNVSFTLCNLTGTPLETKSLKMDTTDYDVIREMLIKEITSYKQKCSQERYGLFGVVIGIHGIVNNDEIIYFVPHHQWRNKDLKSDLITETGVNIYLENNANLCSFAEIVYKHYQSKNLLSVSLYSGIGLGIMVNGKLLKGFDGFAGEIGHMIVVPDGHPCRCGNLGCWEQYASESSFIKQLSERQNKKDLTNEEIHHWLKTKDPITCKLMAEYIKFLSIGLNNIINLYNPEILVINSELLQMYPDAIIEINAHLTSTVGHYRELLISDFGKMACSRGACALAIKKFLDISELSLNIEESNLHTV